MPLSPMMQQYVDMKEKNPDSILLYRMGDFYEMFFEDAVKASKELEITLTKRDCGLEEKAPMCGVPYHSVEAYIARLVEKGYRVTVCEQIKDAVTNEVVDRKITRNITPGTVTEPQMLDETKNSYLVSIYTPQEADGEIGLCFADISTGDIIIGNTYKKYDAKIINDISRYSPREAYINKATEKIAFISGYFKEPSNNCIMTFAPQDGFIYDDCVQIIEKHFGQTPGQLGFTDPVSVHALGGMLLYLHRTQFCSLSHLKNLSFSDRKDYMEIDYFTWRNLEVTETMRAKSKRGSLLSILDETKTAMGARLLRKYLEKPLLHYPTIMKRQNAVTAFFEDNMTRNSLRDLLVSVRDIERIASKLVYDTISPRDMQAFAESFRVLPQIKELLQKFSADLVRELNQNTDPLCDVCSLIDSCISENPPQFARDGNIIRQGYCEELDTLRIFLNDSKQVMANIEAREKERTGIKTLKIGYNKVFGYYIEISKSFRDQVPEDYIRKQTLVNGERFITPELKEVEAKLLTAGDDIQRLETELYTDLKTKVSHALSRINTTAAALAAVDVLSSFAEVSSKNHYTCPDINQTGEIKIIAGRHPVVEKNLKNELFVPNDTFLDSKESLIHIITGPNMAGKSTYMRQVAILVLMAQVGCYVPAEYASVSVTDKLFTRVGASDDLTSGRSTFMVEMDEVAYILTNATEKSLLIFDEIGRGTSTFDGISIARAVVESVAKKIKGKTLFATHYHELSDLESEFPCIKNYNVSARKRENDIVFLRKIVPGGTDDSYGIEVAKLAGIPKDVIRRAEQILSDLEKNGTVSSRKNQREMSQSEELQMSLVGDMNREIIEELSAMDVTTMTPIEAMNVLFSLSRKAKDNNI